jgi:hypothetical protein
MENCPVTMGNSMSGPQRIKNKITVLTRNSNSWNIPETIESKVLDRYLCSQIYIVHNKQKVEATQGS